MSDEISNLLVEMNNSLRELKSRSNLNDSKKVFNLDDLKNYTGFKASTIYKLCAANSIPHSKPTGGKLFFEKSEIEEWLLRNKQFTEQEIINKTEFFKLKKGVSNEV